MIDVHTCKKAQNWIDDRKLYKREYLYTLEVFLIVMELTQLGEGLKTGLSSKKTEQQ